MTLGVFSLYNVMRQEHKANGIMAGLRQFDIELGTFFDQKGVRQLKSVLRLRRTKAISVICSVIFLDTLKIERGLN